MSPQRTFLSLLLIVVVVAVTLCGCAEETADLQQKIATLEKRMQKQEKDLREFSGKFSPPKDFSADIQRLEDQQDKISQVLKTKLDPVNSKLEEFRDWAQDAQKERDIANKKLQSLEQSVSQTQKKTAALGREAGRLSKGIILTRKNLATVSTNVDDLSRSIVQVRKEALDNNAKIVTAVKNTLPKVKDMAVAELRNQIMPLQQTVANLKAASANNRKVLANTKSPQPVAVPSPEVIRNVNALKKQIKDLEDIVTTQKANLLELGAKVHDIELDLRKYSNQ
jgi:chromosome segregation ATPase